jgi:threonylcarbamoyladenosine tRNA methylthiotransferase MtaB
MPLQSGDDAILKSMRRKYSSQEYADFINFVYNTIPNIGIGSDVMVGYPGEDDRAFTKTKEFLADLPISYYHVFTYSDRKGTGSYRMTNRVLPQEKRRRTRILIEQGQRKRSAFYETFLGKVQPVLFEQRIETGNWVGYTPNYMNVEVTNSENLHNQICDVRLLEVRARSIYGEITNKY